MTVLTGAELLRRMKASDVQPGERLVVTPILDAAQIDASQASVDMRLGSLFLSLNRGQVASVDWTSNEALSFARTYVPLGETFVLHPNHFVLAETLEFVRLPRDLVGYVVTKSSWGRTGLIVATAIGVHPNYSGVIALELRNLGDVPVSLHPGTLMLQIFFHTASSPAEKSERSYSRSVEVVAPHPVTDEVLQVYQRVDIIPLKSPGPPS